MIGVLALCAYAGGQAKGGGITLDKIKAKAKSGKAASAGPSANVGDPIRLIGTGFDANVSVEFTGFVGSSFAVQPLSVQGRKVQVAVPSQVVTGSVRLIDPESGTSSPLTLQVVPVAQTLTPADPVPGEQLFIDGSGFSRDTKVKFPGVVEPVTPTIVSPIRIDIVVPQGIQNGKMTVVTSGGTSKPVKIKVGGAAAADAVAPKPQPQPKTAPARKKARRR